ncbi:MAG: hypothetical protein PVS3B3_00990 [Ktedonobacteraceae bacterium]
MPEQQSHVTTYYSEQETASYSHLSVQVIRSLFDAGIMSGIEVVGEERRYSDEELSLLRRIRRLHQDLGINLEGIEIIVRLTARIEALQRELAQYQRLVGHVQEEKMRDNGLHIDEQECS